MQSKKIKFIDLFCGIGGFRLAFEKYKCECVFSSDIDKYACHTYELNFGINPQSDITKIDLSKIPNFDILCAGFPCQPFSIAGKRLGFEDIRGTLFFDIARIIKAKQPKTFFLENVRGITNHDAGRTLSVILEILNKLGYYVEWKVLNSKEYGVPQNRDRWYCVGFRKDIYDDMKVKFVWPKKKKIKINLSDILEKKVSGYKISDICKRNIKINKIKKNIKTEPITLAYEIRPSRCQFSTNGISPCLTAKMGTGGNNIPVVISQSRFLTHNECLKIMGFPDNFIITKDNHGYKQIGNSVVVPVVTSIAKEIVNCLKGVI